MTNTHITADKSLLVPYIVPATYPTLPELTRFVGHGLSAAVTLDLHGLATGAALADLERLGIGSIADAWHTAFENLEAVLRAKIEALVYPDAGLGPMATFYGHWLAASCLMLPNLFDLMSKALHSNELLASIPHRESLVVFPAGDAEQRASMKSKIFEIDGAAPKPLTLALFSLTRESVAAYPAADCVP